MIKPTNETTLGEIVSEVLLDEYDETLDKLPLEIICDAIEEKTREIVREYLHFELLYCQKCGKSFHVTNAYRHQTCLEDYIGDAKQQQWSDDK